MYSTKKFFIYFLLNCLLFTLKKFPFFLILTSKNSSHLFISLLYYLFIYLFIYSLYADTILLHISMTYFDVIVDSLDCSNHILNKFTFFYALLLDSRKGLFSLKGPVKLQLPEGVMWGERSYLFAHSLDFAFF